MDSRHLFVYGTLRPGATAPQAARLAGEARCLGIGESPGRLLRIARYPGLVAGGGRVRGEVYELLSPRRTLEWLDRYEGPDFRREVVTVRLEEVGELQAWAYLYRGPRRGCPEIPGGDFLGSG